MSERFNYIVPIFNKEDVLPKTLEGIERCARGDDRIFCIVDGCTDRSEDIVDEYIKNSSYRAEKILMPNVHMLLSVNEGLKRVRKGYSVIMQDDIVLDDTDMEFKVASLYDSKDGKLGVISFRYGADLRETSLKSSLINNLRYNFKLRKIISAPRIPYSHRMIAVFNILKNQEDEAQYDEAKYDTFYKKMCAINGPNIIPWEVLSSIGFLDERIAPYGYDDPDYSLRSLKAGFINGLFPIKYTSKPEWSGSVRSKEFKMKASSIITKSRFYVWNKHKEFIKDYYKTRETNALSNL